MPDFLYVCCMHGVFDLSIEFPQAYARNLNIESKKKANNKHQKIYTYTTLKRMKNYQNFFALKWLTINHA